MANPKTTRTPMASGTFLIRLSCGDSIGVIKEVPDKFEFEAWRKGACVGTYGTIDAAEGRLIQLDDGM